MSSAAALLPAVGIDIGGTKVAGGLVAADGTGDMVLFSPHLAWRNAPLRADLARPRGRRAR